MPHALQAVTPTGAVCEQIMPPAMRRNKFATDARNASWTAAPASSVWDLRRLRAYTASEMTLSSAI